ncbi:MAG TPA: hypothetical protein VJS92_17425, partial [Candidatus Polarisedimenticolaceae bacterium]|nr:hypothetical protein [Candidatus Polarisedimenticolaceae bacterium]
GTIWGRSGDYARATAVLERAVERQPVSVRAWSNLATARRLSGDRAGAEAAERRARALAR